MSCFARGVQGDQQPLTAGLIAHGDDDDDDGVNVLFASELAGGAGGSGLSAA
jgi:hypothetical protein